MVRLEIDGKPCDPNTLKDALMAAALDAVRSQVQEKIGSIRDPETGEFPTVVIRVTSIDDMQLHIEGSDALIARVREVLGIDNSEGGLNNVTDSSASESNEPSAPRVFLSYTSKDRKRAEQIARALVRNGIDTWWAEWEIRPGDSLRQRIDAGLSSCTHFLVLLTPNSIAKPWVNQEMDAGLVRMLSDRICFLPLRAGLEVAALPPLLRGLHSPELRNLTTDLQQLVHDILGITRKPPLGPVPPMSKLSGRFGGSPAAAALARVFVEHTKTATELDPRFTESQLQVWTGLSREDLRDAIYELRSLVKVREYTGGGFVTAKPELYAAFDALWQPWDPAVDALHLAADLHNDSDFPSTPTSIAKRYGWEARRLNPALAYLMVRDTVEVLTGTGDPKYLCHRVTASDATRRFVKSRGELQPTNARTYKTR